MLSPPSDPRRVTLERWTGLALDAVLVLAVAAVALAGVAPLVVFVALIGPMIGARITALQGTGSVAWLLKLFRLPGRRGM